MKFNLLALQISPMKNSPFLICVVCSVIAGGLHGQTLTYSFGDGIPGEWSGVGVPVGEDGGEKPRSEKLDILSDASPGDNENGRVLVIDMTREEVGKAWSLIATGAILDLRKTMEVLPSEEESVEVKFTARRVGDLPSHLGVMRAYGASNIEYLELSSEWTEYSVLLEPRKFWINRILFSPTDIVNKEKRASGRVEVDNVQIGVKR